MYCIAVGAKSHNIVHLLVWFALMILVADGSDKQHVHLILLSKCGTNAIFQFITSSSVRMPLENCVLTYKPKCNAELKSQRMQLISSNNITITDKNLLAKTICNVTLTCDKVLSEEENFSVDNERCPTTLATTVSWDDSEVIFKKKQTFSSSTTDILLGVIFGVVAIVMVVVTLYYQFRKYQRRRRLQQYLSTPHTDPFESLQDHMEGQ